VILSVFLDKIILESRFIRLKPITFAMGKKEMAKDMIAIYLKKYKIEIAVSIKKARKKPRSNL